MDSRQQSGHPALTDEQTGMPNDLHWDTVFGILFAVADRGIPLTLLLLEMDDYDIWVKGRTEAEVDAVFGALGEAFNRTVRQSDLAARIGKERFSLALVDCNLAGGHLVADRLDALVEPFREEAGLAFSMGVASYNREMRGPGDLMEGAEKALRHAQAQGGDRIEFNR